MRGKVSMNRNQLIVIKENILPEEVQKQMDAEIDQMIHEQKNNRQFLNRIVFDCIFILIEEKPANKNIHIFKALPHLKDYIRQNPRILLYTSQIILQKAADLDLLSLELTVVIINKLSASFRIADQQIHHALNQFFLQYYNKLIIQGQHIYNREPEKNLFDQNFIQSVQSYSPRSPELEPITKIICLVREFHDTTQEEWTNSDFLRLKAIMQQLNISPYLKINELTALSTIAETPDLMKTLLGNWKIQPIQEPSCLIVISTLKKIEDLKVKGKNDANNIIHLLSAHGIFIKEDSIRQNLVLNYMRRKANINLDTEIYIFDFMLNLLYELKQAKSEHLLITQEESIPEKFSYSLNIPSVTESPVLSVSENLTGETNYTIDSSPREKSMPAAVSETDLNNLFLREHTEKAFHAIEKSAQEGNGRALYMMGQYYRGGYGFVQIDQHKADQYFANSYSAGFVPAGYETAVKLPESSKERAIIFEKIRDEIIAMAQSSDCLAENILGLMYDYGQGIKQSYEEAIKWYRKAAEQGFAQAQCNLGLMYKSGTSVTQSSEEAIKWFRKAAEQDNAQAQCNLGLIYKDGTGIAQSSEEAIKWYRKAAEQGYAEAQFRLGTMYEDGAGVEKSDEEAINWFRKAAEQGNADAQFRLNMMYGSKQNSAQSDKGPLDQILKAAKQGNADAQYRLGTMYENGQDVEKSDSNAAEWYLKAARQGAVKAQYNLGRMYLYGWGVNQSDEKAAEWFRQAADQGNITALPYLAQIYKKIQDPAQTDENILTLYQKAGEQGDGLALYLLGEYYRFGYDLVHIDCSKADQYFSDSYKVGFAPAGGGIAFSLQKNSEHALQIWKAIRNKIISMAQNRDTTAENILAHMFQHGLGVKKSYERAIKWYRKAADQGSIPAQYYLGRMYQYGWGVDLSDTKAVNCYRLAANQGYAPAQFSLGQSYQYGWGVKQSAENAAKWLRKAADQGYAPAQNNLGCLYESGHGVALSEEYAVRWYSQAARQGNPYAQTNLGRLYENGQGVPQSNTQAAEWYRKAVKQGFAPAEKNLAKLSSGTGKR